MVCRRAVFLTFFSLTLLACEEKRAPVFMAPPTEFKPNPNVPHDRLPESTASFEETECEHAVRNAVTQCGFVTVPEGPGSEREIRIAVARVFSDSEVPKKEPVVYLEGGPGVATLANITESFEVFSQFAPDRDFVFFDQRGTGISEPGLYCEDGADLGQTLDRCYSELSRDSDLNQYNTINNAADADLIRQAFGYERWNLLGISYGTRLALTIMRDHPGGVRAAVIDSVVPPESDLLGEVGLSAIQSLEATFAKCASQTECAEKYPDPMTQFVDTVVSLNDTPAELVFEDESKLELTGDMFVRVVFNLLYSPAAIEHLPSLIDQVSSEDYSFLTQIAPSALGTQMAFGMHLSLHCSEEMPFSSREAFEAFDAQVPKQLREPLSGMEYWEYCDHWPVDVAPMSEGQPVVSDVRTLVLSGTFDPITPPRFAVSAHENLTNSIYFEIENESHGASTGACGTSLVKSFLQTPDEPVNDSCLGNLTDLSFHGREGVRVAPKAAPLRFNTESPDEKSLEELLEDLKPRLR